MVWIWSVPLRKLAEQEGAGRIVALALGGSQRVRSEIQEGQPQTILGGWVGLAAGSWWKEGYVVGGYVVCGVHGLCLGGSSGGTDVGPRLGFGS